jgi:hypothetical protein
MKRDGMGEDRLHSFACRGRKTLKYIDTSSELLDFLSSVLKEKSKNGRIKLILNLQ